MSLITIFAFSSAMLVLAITPGPGVFGVVATGLSTGFKHAVALSIGIVMGDIIFLLFAIYGLSSIAEHLHWLFMIIKYVGAVYLIYLGLNLWRSKPERINIEDSHSPSYPSSLLTGLLITLGNPKVIVFYIAFLPTFVNLKTLQGYDVALLATAVASILGSVLICYGYLFAKANLLFQNKLSRKLLNRCAGSAMVATGATLAIKA